MDGTAIVLCNGYYRTINGKTAHGLVRGSDRYRILAVVDPPTAGRDAGEALDGIRRGIPIVGSIAEALARLTRKPDYAIVGIATAGGRMTPELRASLKEALEKGLSLVNGLHEFVSDDAELAKLARRNGLTITDIRKLKPRSELHFWTGEIGRLATPRVAVLGTDCALGKRTTTRLLVEACRQAGLRAEWISTGQTGWLQGAPFGILLESLLSEHDARILAGPPLACGIFNIKLMKCGGVASARRIAAIAESAGIRLMWGCMDESRISIAAALEAALSCPATRYLDLDGSLDLACDAVEGGFTLGDGVMRTTDAPGLGVHAVL